MYYYARLICKASVYKLFSELFLATSCLLYADTVPLITFTVLVWVASNLMQFLFYDTLYKFDASQLQG